MKVGDLIEVSLRTFWNESYYNSCKKDLRYLIVINSVYNNGLIKALDPKRLNIVFISNTIYIIKKIS